MIARRTITIEPPIHEKGGIQHRPDHVIEVADEGLPLLEMGILKDCREIVELKVPFESISMRSEGGRDQQYRHDEVTER